MDINVTVAEMRKLSADMHAWQDGDEDPDEPGEYYRIASEMVEYFDAMDGWLTGEGFAPESWPLRSRRDLLAMEQRAYRLRNALLEAGVPENLVRAVELGGSEEEARRALLGTHAQPGEEERARAMARGALLEAGVPVELVRRATQPDGLPQGVDRERNDL